MIHSDARQSTCPWNSFCHFLERNLSLQIGFVHRLPEHFILTFFDHGISRSNYTAIREATDKLAWVHINYRRFCTPDYNAAKNIIEGQNSVQQGLVFCTDSLFTFHTIWFYYYVFLLLNNITSSILGHKWHFLSEQVHNRSKAKLNIQPATSIRLKK